MIPVILSGGSGTRLWPLSRSQYPKQFLPLVTDRTMLQETVTRLDDIDSIGSPVVICNYDHRYMVAEQLREIGADSQAIILEPVGKNTAPAVAMAALAAESPDDVLLVLAADHVIEDVSLFQDKVRQAQSSAEAGHLVTFGIVPNRPETGYDYIRRGSSAGVNDSLYNVDSFVEKQDLEKARIYVDSGEYYWNSGMFAFKASRYLEKLEKHNPEMLAACRDSYNSAEKLFDFINLDKEVFGRCPSDSIDYAVMEKTDSAVVIPLDADWNDVGSWSALWDVSEKDSAGNSLQGDVVAHDTRNSYVHSEYKLVATVGVEDMVVVETDDAVMVAPKNRVQDVKIIVDRLKASGRSEAALHRHRQPHSG
ncbi:mannose-1-phosphate guanylyltransferase/mannose-6-phosphate isomerase [Solemya velesiana gill symbiont]|uniref:mannose-1-phosphate guanylyltransferase n=1 Tax=Solemya velesiana gill symbiont TaxID=1918948 RepID=A0A1T2KN84_9GAMM|nr:mannose-1-phosphate guanylyltransferase/mannose-6-phosphate isomerase [Solemya velesiana gill symbiont]